MTQAILNGVYPVTVAQPTEKPNQPKNDLVYYRIQAFEAYSNLTHAIFTRRGGVSRGPYATLNLSPSVGDDPAAVAQNFQKACEVLDISPDQTVSCHLTHSADIFTVNRTSRRRVMGYGDGMITSEPGIFLAMRFGDCTPLIFFDPRRPAIGVTHAGWRGTMKNAAGATVKAMVSQLGCRTEDVMAVIGPAIGPCCYEVGPDVMAAAEQAFSQPDNLFIRRNGRSDRAQFDMWEANQHQLADSGVRQIIQSNLCTACRTDLFFSHRAERGRTGRFGVIVGLKAAA
jgi:YfiH family protein